MAESRRTASPSGLLRRPMVLLALLVALLATVAVVGLAIGELRLPSSGPTGPAVVRDIPGVGPDPAPAAVSSTTDGRLDALIAQIRANPEDGQAYRDLGIELIQWFRETADPAILDRADQAFREARTRLGDDPMVLVGEGSLQLSRHEFAAALESGTRAVQAAQRLAPAQAVVVDALVELGRYDEAITATERLAGLDQGLSTLARVSYIRELHGDLDGALEAMRRAAVLGATAAPENLAFVLVIVGNLQIAAGDPEGAIPVYDLALERFPNYAPALAAKGRLAVGRGDLATAVDLLEHASAILPLPEYVIALGEAHEALGDEEAASDSYALARFQSELLAASGVVVDLELVVFEADHGDPAKALTLAETAYHSRPNVRAADALAWALYRSGRLAEADARMSDALRLGTRDALMLYHAGVISDALGRTDEARTYLEDALATDAGWSAVGAGEARRILASLP